MQRLEGVTVNLAASEEDAAEAQQQLEKLSGSLDVPSPPPDSPHPACGPSSDSQQQSAKLGSWAGAKSAARHDEQARRGRALSPPACGQRYGRLPATDRSRSRDRQQRRHSRSRSRSLQRRFRRSGSRWRSGSPPPRRAGRSMRSRSRGRSGSPPPRLAGCSMRGMGPGRGLGPDAPLAPVLARSYMIDGPADAGPLNQRWTLTTRTVGVLAARGPLLVVTRARRQGLMPTAPAAWLACADRRCSCLGCPGAGA